MLNIELVVEKVQTIKNGLFVAKLIIRIHYDRYQLSHIVMVRLTE